MSLRDAQNFPRKTACSEDRQPHIGHPMANV
jgi:hypothetical protein